MRRLSFVLLLLFTTPAQAAPDAWPPNSPVLPGFAFQLARHRVTGCFLLQELSTGVTRIHDPIRASQGTLPASTFKVPNSLISLEAGVTTAAETFRWDGSPQPFRSWQRDVTLEQAFRGSVVWAYQGLARRVGLKRMTQALETLGYGNGVLSAGQDRFWLEGPFRVTPLEQLTLMGRLMNNELPFARRHQQSVREWLRLETFPDGTVLGGKTGWARVGETQIGWMVGYVRGSGQTWAYVLRVISPEPVEGWMTLRLRLTKTALQLARLLP